VVNYTLVNGSTAAGDFSPPAAASLWPPRPAYGTYNYNISLADILTDDSTVEANETFTLRLSAPGDVAGSYVRFQSYYPDYNNAYGTLANTLDVAAPSTTTTPPTP
jgi:hypothetical protein